MTDAPERIWLKDCESQGKDKHPSEWFRPEIGMTAQEYIRLDLHEAAVAAARADGWNAAINAAADEAEEHKAFANGIECCDDCIRKLAEASK